MGGNAKVIILRHCTRKKIDPQKKTYLRTPKTKGQRWPKNVRAQLFFNSETSERPPSSYTIGYDVIKLFRTVFVFAEASCGRSFLPHSTYILHVE